MKSFKIVDLDAGIYYKAESANRIHTIKVLRIITGMSLQEATEEVQKLEKGEMRTFIELNPNPKVRLDKGSVYDYNTYIDSLDDMGWYIVHEQDEQDEQIDTMDTTEENEIIISYDKHPMKAILRRAAEMALNNDEIDIAIDILNIMKNQRAPD